MPQDLLAFPPYYVVVGVYRLLTDPPLRKAVWDKLKHATARGLLISTAYVAVTYKTQRWFVSTFLMGGFGLFGKTKPPPELVESSLGWLRDADIVDYTTILFILPQITSLLHYFLKRNLLLAKSRAWDLTVKSRNKPAEFWSKGYVEEWEQPPSLRGVEGKGFRGKEQERWLSWVLWWPSQMALRHYVLIPLSPYLPLYNIAFTSAMRGLYTARVLHNPYFQVKNMTPAEVELWLEERKWGYRSFGFTASLLESIPILGLGFQITNRIGAAMWAFDLEKRQHLFANGELKRLPPGSTGVLGVGRVAIPSKEPERFEMEEMRRGRAEGL